MCFVDLQKAFNRVAHGVLWEVVQEYRIRDPLYDWSRRFALPAGSQTCFQYMLDSGRAALCPCSVHYIYSMVRMVRQLQPGARRSPVWEAQDFISFIPSSQDLQSCTLFDTAAVVMRSGYWTVLIKKELRQKAKLSIYWSIFFSPTNSGSWPKELDLGYKQGGGTQIGCSSVTREDFGVESLLLHMKKAEGSWMPSWGGVLGMPHQEEALRRPKTHWSDYVTRLAWECLGILLDNLQ